MSTSPVHSRLGLCAAALALVILGWALWNAGRFLVVNQPPKKSAAIIVLGGGPVNRIEKAAQLYHQGYAPLLITSGGTLYSANRTQAAEMAMQAQRRGVPAANIALDQKSQSTAQNAQDTLVLMLRRHLDSAIVVSSNYHMRRVQWLFNRTYRGHHIRLTYVAASDPWFHPEHWWSNSRSIAITTSEYLKLLVAFALGQ